MWDSCIYSYVDCLPYKQYKMVNKYSDDFGDSMPPPDILTNVDNENQFENPLHKQLSTKKNKKDIRANSITGLGSKRKTQPFSTKNKQQQQPKSPTPNRMMSKGKNNSIKSASHNGLHSINTNGSSNMSGSDSEYFADIQPTNNNNNDEQSRLKPNITPQRASRRDSAPNVKKRQLPSDYIFRSEESMETEKQRIKEQKNKRGLRAKHQVRKTTAPAPTRELPRNSRSPSPSPKKPLPKVIYIHDIIYIVSSYSQFNTKFRIRVLLHSHHRRNTM